MQSGDSGVNLPVNIRRLILNAQTKFGAKPHRPGSTGLDPMYIIKQVQEMCQRLIVVAGEDTLSKWVAG